MDSPDPDVEKEFPGLFGDGSNNSNDSEINKKEPKSTKKDKKDKKSYATLDDSEDDEKWVWMHKNSLNSLKSKFYMKISPFQKSIEK